MWKLYLIGSILLAGAAAWDWRASVKREWVYSVIYSFQGGNGSGRMFVVRSAPIQTATDIESVDRYISEQHKNVGKAFVTDWKEIP